jgi:hypothetical protein
MCQEVVVRMWKDSYDSYSSVRRTALYSTIMRRMFFRSVLYVLSMILYTYITKDDSSYSNFIENRQSPEVYTEPFEEYIVLVC